MRSILFFFFAVCCMPFYAGEYDLSGLQGLRDKKGKIFFEWSGYDISVKEIGGQPADTKMIDRIKKQYGIGEILADYSESAIPSPNRVIESVVAWDESSGVLQSQACYLLTKPDEKFDLIFFETFNQRDIPLEHYFIQSYLEGKLGKYISNDWDVYFIEFAGSPIRLGNDYKWKKPHCLEGKGAQLSWSEFSSLESALYDNENRMLAHTGKGTVILAEEPADIIFQGISSKAWRIVYKKENSSTPYLAYYAVQERGGKFISYVMTDFKYDENGDPPPLFITMIKETLWPEERITDSHYEQSLAVVDDDYTLNFLSFQFGTWIPIMQLSNVFNRTVSFGMDIACHRNHNMALDLGMQFGFPLRAKKFGYKVDRYYDIAKTNFLFEIHLRLRKEKKLQDKLFLSYYAGAGAFVLSTDLESGFHYDEDGEEVSEYYSITTFDLFAGVSLRHKRFGIFTEYYFVPFSVSGKVQKGFGHSMIGLGLFFVM